VTLVEPSFPRGIGLRVNVASNGLPPEFVLFGEDASRVLVACDPAHLEGIKQVAARHSLALDLLGETVAGEVEIKLDGQVVVAASIAELSGVYESALEKALRTDPALVAAD
jgi:phosphoribosylformylglycinamidine (FGAM) synthase-like enzyme